MPIFARLAKCPAAPSRLLTWPRPPRKEPRIYRKAPSHGVDLTALYALPDHEVVSGLIPGIGDRHLGIDEAVEQIRATPGMIPVAIDPESESGGGGKVYWADIGSHPYREWQHIFTVATLAQRGEIGQAFATDFAILQDDRILADPIEPSGFLFHISRCGSTLTGKALARSEHHVVINQGAPLQRGFWAAITRDWSQGAAPSPENLKAFRNLVLALTRRRQPQEERAFIKFISWNTLYMDFALGAFPATPALFLYREPVEVIASVLRETSAVVWAKGRPQAGFLSGQDWRATGAMDEVEYLAHCFANYLGFALQMEDRVHLLNYVDIKPGNFADILALGLDFRPASGELALMLEQFNFHSKDDSDRQQFKSDSAQKRASIPEADRRRVAEICGDLMQRLDRSPANLFPRSQSLASAVRSG